MDTGTGPRALRATALIMILVLSTAIPAASADPPPGEEPPLGEEEPPPETEGIVVDEARVRFMDPGDLLFVLLQVEGEGAVPNGVVTIVGVGDFPADDEGAFEIEVDNFFQFAVVLFTCTVTATDGVSTATAEIRDCPVPPPFTGPPIPFD